MADEGSRPRSPRRENDRPSRNEGERERDRDDRPRRRSRSPRRQDDRNRDRDREFERRDDRNRERNRDRRDERPRRGGGGGGGGFKWKQKRPENSDERDQGDKRLERGYRKRSRSPRRDRNRPDDSKGGRSGGCGGSGVGGAGNSVEDKFGVADKFGLAKSKDETSTGTDEPPKRPAASAPAAASGEPMIIVHVNDRLGTKAAIPCLASDPIKLFKAQVAARIGRQPHEILLKRQGERPFKDQLTLEDYGVSNGVQIDLEIDTGE